VAGGFVYADGGGFHRQIRLGQFNSGGEAEPRQGRRYAVGRRIAGLFASYASQRPRLLADWSARRATNGIGARAPRRPMHAEHFRDFRVPVKPGQSQSIPDVLGE
jgi:exonuclease V gamma subunit